MRISGAPILTLLCLLKMIPVLHVRIRSVTDTCFKMSTCDVGPKYPHVRCPRAITCGPRFEHPFSSYFRLSVLFFSVVLVAFLATRPVVANLKMRLRSATFLTTFPHVPLTGIDSAHLGACFPYGPYRSTGIVCVSTSNTLDG